MTRMIDLPDHCLDDRLGDRLNDRSTAVEASFARHDRKTSAGLMAARNPFQGSREDLRAVEHAQDIEIARRAARGDTAAQHDLMLRLLPRVRRAVAAILRSGERSDVDDAVQQALMDILGGMAGYRGECALDGWAERIAVRRAIKISRKQRLRSDAIDAQIDPASTAALCRRPELHERLPRPLEDYLRALPEIHRVAVILRHAFGYSLAEIADFAGTSSNTVKARLLHGTRKLRSMIERDRAGGIGGAGHEGSPESQESRHE